MGTKASTHGTCIVLFSNNFETKFGFTLPNVFEPGELAEECKPVKWIAGGDIFPRVGLVLGQHA